MDRNKTIRFLPTWFAVYQTIPKLPSPCTVFKACFLSFQKHYRNARYCYYFLFLSNSRKPSPRILQSVIVPWCLCLLPGREIILAWGRSASPGMVSNMAWLAIPNHRFKVSDTDWTRPLQGQTEWPLREETTLSTTHALHRPL